jgi:hypothetical protein
MRILFAAGLACAACALVQCKPREFDNDSGVKSSTLGDGVTQVNAKAFNAYKLWNDVNKIKILDSDYITEYPQDYAVNKGTTTPDDALYFSQKANWYSNNEINRFTGKPTEGAKVVNDVLEYPVKNGKKLNLKFTAESPNRMKDHAEAAEHCKQQGLRLPHILELFDFCAAGVKEGPWEGTWKANRCGNARFWSASVVSEFRNLAWIFYASNGFVVYESRDYNRAYVRCVGPEQ